MYKYVFLDVDDTIFDFLKTERVAITKTLSLFGIDPTDELIAHYSRINQRCWEKFERGEITRARVLIERFETLFSELGVTLDPQEVEDTYQRLLGVGHIFVEGAEDIIAYLAPKYHLYIASNGVAMTQDSRLKSSGIVPNFDGIFISERTGYHKPEKEYFDYCFARIPGFRPEEAIIVGDSLSSDILGGKNAGIATCWFNYRGKPARADIQPDYTIHKLEELKNIL